MAAMGTIHIAEADLAQNLKTVLAQVKAGNEVVIESDMTDVAVLKSPELRIRPVDESIARMKAFEKKLGYAPVMDEDFASDMREIIANRQPRKTVWDEYFESTSGYERSSYGRT